MKQIQYRRFAAASIVACLVVAAPAAAQDDGDRGNPSYFINSRPSGWYFKAAGGLNFQENTGAVDSSGMSGPLSISFDTGWLGTIGVGKSFEQSPLSLELEYTYRQAQIESITSGGAFAGFGSTPESHAVMFNGVLDFDLGFTSLGLYVGAGAGVAYTDANLNLASGTVSDDDWTFAYQIFGGVKYNLNDQWLLYTGLRWFDAGDVDVGTFDPSNESLAWEVGFRYYF